MKKKWMGGLLALALAALCMLPTQVQAASTSTTEKHMHGDVECILWTDERAREQCGPNSTASNSLPYVDYGQLGIYCLTKDVYLPKDWTPYTWWGGTNSLTICLNGHTINGAGILGKDEATYNDITDQQSVTLMDCTEDASKRGSFGVYNSAGSKNSAILLKRGNNLTLSNVTLTGIDCAKAAITVGDRATLNLCDGASIEYNKSTGDKQATIVINKGGTFNMTGGQIRDNKGYAGGVLNNGTFNMYGGSIRNNGRASSVGSNVGVRYGGGVYVGTSGTFTMTGGDIMGNSVITGGQGSAIYVDDGGALKLGKNVQIWNNNSASSIAFANDSANISIIRRLSDSAKIDIGSLSADRVTQTGNNFYAV